MLPTSEYVTTHAGSSVINAVLAGMLGLLVVTVFGVGALIGATGLLVRRARRADPEQNEANTPGSAPGGTRTVTA